MGELERQPPFDAREFREALGCYPTGVTIVTAVGPRREIIGITANSFSSVSVDPPLVLFSINRRAHSARAFLQTQHLLLGCPTAFSVSPRSIDSPTGPRDIDRDQDPDDPAGHSSYRRDLGKTDAHPRRGEDRRRSDHGDVRYDSALPDAKLQRVGGHQRQQDQDAHHHIAPKQ